MIEYFISISEAPSKIAQLPEQFAEDSSAVIVTSEGEPVMAILPYSEYKFLEKIDSLLETVKYPHRDASRWGLGSSTSRPKT